MNFQNFSNQMSTVDLPVGWNKPTNALIATLSFAALYIVYLLISSTYEVYFGPLSKFPGRKSWAFSKLPRIITMVGGNDATVLAKLHQQYGPVVRTGPRDLSYASGASAFKDIYGFNKHDTPHVYKDPIFYVKPLNNVDNIFTADDINHRRQRKILSHAFSDKALKEQESLLKRWAQLMRTKLAERANGEETADMLKYYNCTTFDIMGKEPIQHKIVKTYLLISHRQVI